MNRESGKEKKKDAKKSPSKTKKTTPSEEEDSEKIQRLIKQQAKEQEEGRRNRRHRKKEFDGGRMDERKRHELQMRLREIHDVDRLRRELRKIRTKEMSEEDYSEIGREPWERDMDSRIPEEVRRDMRRRRFERMEDPEDLKRELRMRIIDLDDDDDDGDFLGHNSFVFRELRQRYMMEAEEIGDPSELMKRIDDLDALTAIFHGGERDHRRWRNRHRRHMHRDEL